MTSFFTKNDRYATTEGISIFEINDAGKIGKVSSYWDEAALMAKLKDASEAPDRADLHGSKPNKDCEQSVVFE